MSTFELPCPLPAGTDHIIAHLLKCIADNTSGGATGGGTVAGQREFEGWIPFCDANGDITGFIAVIFDEDTGAQTETYRDSNFSETATRPTGTPCVSTNDGVYRNLTVVCRYDDVNSDGNPEDAVPFYEACLWEIVNGVLTSTTQGTFQDSCLMTPYVVQGAILDVGSLGQTVTGVAPLYRVVENGASWNAPGLAQTVKVTAVTVADTNNPPTLETAAGTFPLFQNIPLEFEASDCSHMLRGTFTVQTQAGDVVAVTATELSTI